MPTVPPLPELVAAAGSSTEEGLTLQVEEGLRLRLRGTARQGEGEVNLSFEGVRVSVAVAAGTSARAAALLLQKAMPAGYRVTVAPGSEDEVLLEVVRRPKERNEVPAPAAAVQPVAQPAVRAAT